MDQRKRCPDEVNSREQVSGYIAEPPHCPHGGQYTLNGLDGRTAQSVHSP